MQTTLATTKDTSCESAVTSGQHSLTTQHPPRDASPAGLVALWLLCPFLSSMVLDHVVMCLVAHDFIFEFYSRLLSIAEETLAEFLSKATGTAVEWVQMPGMKVILKSINLFIIGLLSYFIIKFLVMF